MSDSSWRTATASTWKSGDTVNTHTAKVLRRELRELMRSRDNVDTEVVNYEDCLREAIKRRETINAAISEIQTLMTSLDIQYDDIAAVQTPTLP